MIKDPNPDLPVGQTTPPTPTVAPPNPNLRTPERRPPQPPLPERIGKYRIDAWIDRGGQGDVYQAWDPDENRPVAIKVLLTPDEDRQNRFRKEARAVGKLNHRNIVKVFEFNETEGMPYLVMEYLVGMDLRKLTRAKGLNLFDKLAILTQVAAAVAFAHQNQIIHRDLKPSNVVFLTDGSVKILDFGIARDLDTSATRLTHVNALLGTYSYMSPEQLNLHEASKASDIWAFGVMAQELLVGRHPFAATDLPQIVHRIQSTDPDPISSLAPDTPEAVSVIISMCLRKDPSDRLQSLDTTAEELASVLDDEGNIVIDALFNEGKLEEAQNQVGRLLVTHPNSSVSPVWQARLAEENHRRKVRPQVEALLGIGQAAIQERRFGDALQALESALLLVEDSEARALLQKASALLEADLAATKLLDHAQSELAANRLSEARLLAVEAQVLDAAHPRLAGILDEIDARMAEEKKKELLSQRLTEARQLVDAGSYEDVLLLLEGLLGENPTSAEILGLIRSTRRAVYVRGEWRRVEMAWEHAHQLSTARNFAAALELVMRSLWPEADAFRHRRQASEGSTELNTSDTVVRETLSWSSEEYPFVIQCSARMLDDIRLSVMDAFFAAPRGGVEIGGILLGNWDGKQLTIRDYATLDCEHALGPLFTLSPRDEARFAELLVAPAENGLQPIGWYHSHTRSEIFLSDVDQEIHRRFFPEPWQVALVMKPHTFQPTRAGFFFREANGGMMRGTHQEALEPLPTQQWLSLQVPDSAKALSGLEFLAPAIPERTRGLVEASRNAILAPPEVSRFAASAPGAGENHISGLGLANDAQEEPLPSLRMGWLRVTLALLTGFALGTVAYLRRDVWLPPLAEVVRQHLPAPPLPGLNTFDQSGQLQIRWNRNSPAILQASGGVMTISAGTQPPQEISLDKTYLQAGVVTIARETERVDVSLALTQPDGQTVREMATFVGKLPEPNQRPTRPLNQDPDKK